MWRFQRARQQAEAKFWLVGTQGRGTKPSSGAPNPSRLALGKVPALKAFRGVFHLNHKQNTLPGMPQHEVHFGASQAAVLDQKAESLRTVEFEGMGFGYVACPAAFRGEKDVHPPNLPPSGSGSRL